MWQWLTQTSAGLAARIGGGIIIFSILAAMDFHKHRAAATRWREYLFLFSCVLIAMVYGIANDLITSSISWEYFCYGKELWPNVIATLPPDAMELKRAAAVVGMKATWTAGLLIGACLLIANNPFRGVPRLPYRKLFAQLLIIATCAISFAAILGIAGYIEKLTWMNNDFGYLVRNDQWHPRRFMATFGVHLGGYVGGLLGLVIAICSVVRSRIKSRHGVPITRVEPPSV